MRTHIPLIRSLAASALIVAAGAAGAQTWKLNCTNSGTNASEPLGDREKHSLHVQTAACLHEGGPTDGAVVTQGVIWEHDATGSRIISGDGVARKPGLTAVYRVTDGTLTWVMQDGKPAGWNAVGKGSYTLAVGGAAQLAGKTFSWTSRPTGPRTYVTEMTLD